MSINNASGWHYRQLSIYAQLQLTFRLGLHIGLLHSKPKTFLPYLNLDWTEFDLIFNFNQLSNHAFKNECEQTELINLNKFIIKNPIWILNLNWTRQLITMMVITLSKQMTYGNTSNSPKLNSDEQRIVIYEVVRRQVNYVAGEKTEQQHDYH